VFFAPAPRNLETTVGQEPVPAGTWYCPVTAGEGQESRVTVAAVGDEPSTVVVMRYKDAKVVDDPAVDVAIGQSLEIPHTTNVSQGACAITGACAPAGTSHQRLARREAHVWHQWLPQLRLGGVYSPKSKLGEVVSRPKTLPAASDV